MNEKQIKSVITSLRYVKEGLYETEEELRELAMVLIADIQAKTTKP